VNPEVANNFIVVTISKGNGILNRG